MALRPETHKGLEYSREYEQLDRNVSGHLKRPHVCSSLLKTAFSKRIRIAYTLPDGIVLDSIVGCRRKASRSSWSPTAIVTFWIHQTRGSTSRAPQNSPVERHDHLRVGATGRVSSAILSHTAMCGLGPFRSGGMDRGTATRLQRK